MSGTISFVTPQQVVVHALFARHRSMSVVARILGLSQIRVRETLVQHERNRMRDAGLKPPPLKEMLRGDVTTRFGVPREEFGGRPAKHVQLGGSDGVSMGRDRARAASRRMDTVTATGAVRFVVTAVESGARVHAGFWRNLQAYAKTMEATVVVARVNRVATTGELRADYSQFVAIDAIKVDHLIDLAFDETVAARLVRPLDGMRHRIAAQWTVVPHGAIQFETLPRMRADGLRVHLTSGAMTLPRPGSSPWRRELGAVVAEVSANGVAHCRHLLAPADGDGSFQDLDATVSSGVVRRGHGVEAITFGDVHHAHLEPTVAIATWGSGPGGAGGVNSLVDRLRPGTMVFHDVLDFEARSHHDARDHHKRFAQMANGGGDVRAELAATAGFLADTRRDWFHSIVVGSNHDAAFVRWLRESDFREDPLNAVFFLESSLDLHRRIADGLPSSGFFERTLRRLTPDGLAGVRFLEAGESLKIVGSEAAIHGHLGADGRQGSVQYFERLGIRATLGHTHRPLTRDGIYCAGVCATELAYARGPITSWAVGHVVTYSNGARQHLLFNGGEFHA